MIKRLFCKHTYKYYHRDEYLSFLTSSFHPQWHYVCDKCGKKNRIQEQALNDFIRDKSKKVAMEETMGIDNSKYDDLTFVIADRTVTGKLAYYTRKRLHQFKQDKPIHRGRW